MPQIIVTADRPSDHGQGTVTLCERINVSDFESDHFAAMLVERLGWAVSDADQAERESATDDQRASATADEREFASAPERESVSAGGRVPVTAGER
jgi:hypothetical protein